MTGIGYDFICKHCGESFNSEFSFAKFCSTKCKATHYRNKCKERARVKRGLTKSICACGNSMMAKSTTCHKCKKGRPVKKEGMARQLICQHCHKEFRSATGKAKYCSTDCHNEAKGRIPTGRVKGICLDCGQPISHVALRCAKCAYIHKVASRVVPNNGSALQRAMVRMLKGEETENDLAIIDQHDTINEEERIFKQAIKAEQILAKLGVPSSKYFNCYRGVKR